MSWLVTAALVLRCGAADALELLLYATGNSRNIFTFLSSSYFLHHLFYALVNLVKV